MTDTGREYLVNFWTLFLDPKLKADPKLSMTSGTKTRLLNLNPWDFVVQGHGSSHTVTPVHAWIHLAGVLLCSEFTATPLESQQVASQCSESRGLSKLAFQNKCEVLPN